MRKTDCVEAKTCHCDCHNCIQYRSISKKNREDLIMKYVKEYQNHPKAGIEISAKLFLTPKEYRVFEFEIQNHGV